ncbi:adenylyltransferase/cytidyltransferase family protein [Candidatus Daviesbacteria bacterium]|nr:adenylyltransferase/cytidyltransferase family protein [Candidatus Daviesbacteria bacterium]
MDKKVKHNKIVLVGGCFDVLHPGHIFFLEKAKKMGDFLVVILESDEKIKRIKGNNRPIYSQKERAVMLKALNAVDKVVLLPFIDEEKEYDKVVGKIKPDIIATTQGDPSLTHKQRTAKLTGAKLKIATRLIKDYSTTNILAK